MQHKIWAHRGASGYMPENTLSSFQKAVELGADGVELDIQLTKDNRIVVCHDEKIDRTSNGQGYIKDYTYEELTAYNFNKTHPEVTHAAIPLMSEVFDLLQDTNLTINIELKTGVFDYEGIEEMIVRMVKDKGFEERVIYSSFNHHSILKIQEIDPHAKVAFLYEDGPIDFVTYAHKHHVDAIHPWIYNLRYPHVTRDAKKYNLQVNVWTVNDEEGFAYCDLMGVDAVITNFPDKARKYYEDKREAGTNI